MSPIGAILGAFIITLIYCEFAERVTAGFDEICDMICDLQWYLFPKEIQKMMLTIIVNSQEPVTMQGFANCSCSREQFKKVGFIKSFCCVCVCGYVFARRND